MRLFPSISGLAYDMQDRWGEGGGASQVEVEYQEALDLLSDELEPTEEVHLEGVADVFA